jgi:hypothetical protein
MDVISCRMATRHEPLDGGITVAKKKKAAKKATKKVAKKKGAKKVAKKKAKKAAKKMAGCRC